MIRTPWDAYHWAYHVCSGRTHYFWGLPPRVDSLIRWWSTMIHASPCPCWGVCKTFTTDRGRAYTDTLVFCHDWPQSLRTQKSSLPIGHDPNLRMAWTCTSNVVRYSNIKSHNISIHSLNFWWTSSNCDLQLRRICPFNPFGRSRHKADGRFGASLEQSTTSVIVFKLHLEHDFSDCCLLLDSDHVCTCPGPDRLKWSRPVI